MQVEQGKIREFARATKTGLSAYQGPNALIPPTFLTTAGNLWASSPDSKLQESLGFNLAHVLHGEEDFQFFGPLPQAGQTLRVDTRIGDRWEKQGKRGGTMRFAVIVTEYRDSGGSLVAEQRTTIIETAQPPEA